MTKLNGLLSCALTHLVAVILAVAIPVFAADPTATLAGRVDDPTGGVVPGTKVQATNVDTNVSYYGETNDVGAYRIPGLPPGHYRMIIEKPGFAKIVKPGIELHVQDVITVNFQMRVGSVSESVTVESGSPVLNTESAAVSTVVDRQFAENLPMNGRSFQTLIQLTPGVVLTVSNGSDSGQFSVNGQRAASNYWMVDGVGANIGIGVGSVGNAGNGLGGTVGSFSALGGTNSLVSVDAMQEFRVQTSTYAPEFGRTPGGQISIVTRSGTNQIHGTAFNYFRNDALDANNWFNGYINAPPLQKAKERQNDFGGTLSGPIIRNRAFFFFSYEGLRLRLPQTSLTTVPDETARQNAVPGMQPYLNAYPLPNGADDVATGVAQFNATYSNPAMLNAYSLRIDDKASNKLNLFGRYNYSPSENVQRGVFAPLNAVLPARFKTQTGTVGATWSIKPTMLNDLRLNYSLTDASSHYFLDNFGGAIPLASLPFPSPFSKQNANIAVNIFALQNAGQLIEGANAHNLQRQINIVDNMSLQRGSHSLKFGVDFRRLSPKVDPPQYTQSALFFDVPSAETGSICCGGITSSKTMTVLFRNLGIFAQDTWRVTPNLTLTYGLRWDVDFAPSSLNGPSIPAVTGYDLNDLSNLAVAQAGTPPFKTTYGDVAPRVGLAWQINQKQERGTLLRGGFGFFYDLVSSETGIAIGSGTSPFASFKSLSGSSFPYDSSMVNPPPIPAVGNISGLYAFNPRLKLPYTLEWNLALEELFGKWQTLTASYVGATGRRLLQTTQLSAPPTNPAVFGNFVDNTATSDYHALQLQFQRRLSRGLQALASYTWSHSIDTASAGSLGNLSNAFVPGSVSRENRGSSDFDIRHALSVALTYDVPAPKINRFAKAVFRDWSLESVIQSSSARPVDIADSNFINFNGGVTGDVRPDVVKGQPLYLFGSQCLQAPPVGFGVACPGQKGFNPAAFTDPPTTPSGCVPGVDFPCDPARQGNLGRNALRGFGAFQWDFAIRREFLIHESLKLQLRTEMFNVLNHPNFGQPSGAFGRGGFGLSTQILAQYLDGGGTSNVGGGSFSPLYQMGGPRSIQFALKVLF
jgi:hypothetical protein